MAEEGDAPDGGPVKINACDGSHVVVNVTINRQEVDLLEILKLVHGETKVGDAASMAMKVGMQHLWL